MKPEWLPEPAQLRGQNVEQDYEYLLKIYEQEFVEHGMNITVEGESVFVNTSPNPNFGGKYPYGFTHVVTRELGGVRVFDPARAEKLPWIRPVLENYRDAQYVRVFWSDRNKKSARRLHIWLYDFDFMIVLDRMKSKRFSGKMIMTAFSVDPHQRRYYQKLFDTSDEVIVPCSS